MNRAIVQVLSLLMCCTVTIGIGCGPTTPSSNRAASERQSSPPGSAQPDPLMPSVNGATNSHEPKSSVGEVPGSLKQLELMVSTWEQLQAGLMKHAGKVVVIDVWSTSCEPCLREFPRLVALQQKHPSDVVAISFNCDYIGVKSKPVEFYRDRVMKSLMNLHAEGIINVMSSIAADELFQQLDLDSIPAVYVFDRTGKLAKRFDNRTPASPTEEGISYETQIDPLVADLVKTSTEN